MRSYFVTLVEALGHRRYLIGALSSAIIGAWDRIADSIATNFDLSSVPSIQNVLGIPSWVVAGVIITGLVFFWVLAYATKLRLSAEPKLNILFQPDDPDLGQIYAWERPDPAIGRTTCGFRVCV